MKRKWWQGRSAGIEARADDVGIPTPDESVPDARVTDTGSADARDGAVAVSGIRGPGPAGQTRASGTGDAIAVAGVAVSGVVGSIGDIDQSVRTYAAPRAPAAWPHQVGVIPRRAEAFVRRAEMAEIRDVGLPASCRILTGTGGVGKTQLAADFARRAWDADEVDVLVWITATTRSAIVTGYARAAVELLGMDGDDPDEAAKSFLAWLEPKPNQRPCRWLIVLDDVADPTDLRGLWPPPGPHGCCVLTTRRRDAALGPERRLTHVDLFTADQAAAYLTTALAAHGRAEPADQLASLAADLGRLPLALSQAVAYLVDAGVDCATYRRLLAERLPEPDTLPDDQTLAVSALWSLSIDRANRLTPVGLALPMLRLAAMLDPNGIPGTVLIGVSARDHLAEDRDRRDSSTEERAVAREESAVSVDDAIGALRALHRLNLIDHITHGPLPTVRVHQLVQRTARAPLASVERDRLARIAADSLVDVWPEGERDAELVEALRANTDVLCGHAGAALWHREAHVAMYHAGKSLGTTGRVGAAAEHFRQMLTTAHRHLGADHPDTLMIRSNLAGWRAEAGDAAGAARAFEELLADELRILGPDHSNTLTTR
ncbi:tetratricopeptide repeat protein, partial [Embleya sp. NPDC056538]